MFPRAAAPLRSAPKAHQPSSIRAAFAAAILAAGLLSAALPGSGALAQDAGDPTSEAEDPSAITLDASPVIDLALAPPDPAAAQPADAKAVQPAVLAAGSVPGQVVAAPPKAAPAIAGASSASAKIAATVVDNRFQPTTVTVAVGGTVTWTNNGNNLHTLSSIDGLFDSGALANGQSFSYTFDKPGTYRLICRQHGLSGMASQVVVQ